MVDNIYIEKCIKNQKITLQVLERVKPKNIIYCNNYREVFNPKNQNFKLQKIKPSLILAKKESNLLTLIPESFGIGGEKNFYFSHMLNCIYDCRYCFLQGMFNSANYVVFVNYNDFKKEIHKKIELYKSKTIHFFSGYDCDSLALEPMTNFFSIFMKNLNLPQNVLIELRTKSTQINFLLERKVIQNFLIAFSLNPEYLIKLVEHKTPSLKKRIHSIKCLANKGWKVGLRFDPIIKVENYKSIYKDFFKFVFDGLQEIKIHSATIGSLRMPDTFLKKIKKLYPNELSSNYRSLDKEKNEEVITFCKDEISKYMDKQKIYLNT
jgi:spore photoproduct lyase